MPRHCTATPPTPFRRPDPTPRIDFVNADEIAAWLGISRYTVIAWGKQGHLPAPVRVGRKFLRWHRADVLRHLRERGILQDAV